MTQPIFICFLLKVDILIALDELFKLCASDFPYADTNEINKTRATPLSVPFSDLKFLIPHPLIIGKVESDLTLSFDVSRRGRVYDTKSAVQTGGWQEVRLRARYQ
jgi:hypothetical protein